MPTGGTVRFYSSVHEFGHGSTVTHFISTSELRSPLCACDLWPQEGDRPPVERQGSVTDTKPTPSFFFFLSLSCESVPPNCEKHYELNSRLLKETEHSIVCKTSIQPVVALLFIFLVLLVKQN